MWCYFVLPKISHTYQLLDAAIDAITEELTSDSDTDWPLSRKVRDLTELCKSWEACVKTYAALGNEETEVQRPYEELTDTELMGLIKNGT